MMAEMVNQDPQLNIDHMVKKQKTHLLWQLQKPKKGND